MKVSNLIYICPECEHVFIQGEWDYNYDTALLDFQCPECGWEGNEKAVHSIKEGELDIQVDNLLGDWGEEVKQRYEDLRRYHREEFLSQACKWLKTKIGPQGNFLIQEDIENFKNYMRGY